LSIQQVIPVDVEPARAADALVNGYVDAWWFGDPRSMQLKTAGHGIIKWRPQSEQVAYCSVIGTNDWIAQHADLVNRLLKAMALAEISMCVSRLKPGNRAETIKYDRCLHGNYLARAPVLALARSVAHHRHGRRSAWMIKTT